MSSLYNEIFKLKTIIRKGWIMRHACDKESGRYESDAEHTFSMALLAYEIMKRENLNLDEGKVLKLALIHELCEIDAGDHTPFDKITKEEKYKLERDCMERLAKDCEMPELLDLWLEYKHGLTPEGRFVSKMDKLDAILQSKIYSEQAQDNALFDEFYEFSKDFIKEFDKYTKK